MVNVELMDRVMTRIKDHPTAWNQADWICDTTACFAGTAILLASGLDEVRIRRWATGKEPSPFPNRAYSTVAGQLLDLDDAQRKALFYRITDNVDELERIVKSIVNGENVDEDAK